MKPNYRPEDEILPLLLNAEPFASTWKLWCKDRRDKKKPLTPQAAKIQIGKMVDLALVHGNNVAAAVVEHAINNGWTGLWIPEDYTLKQIKRTLTETNSTKNGSNGIALERKRSEEKLWKLWNELEITDEERQRVLRDLDAARSADDIRRVMGGIRK